MPIQGNGFCSDNVQKERLQIVHQGCFLRYSLQLATPTLQRFFEYSAGAHLGVVKLVEERLPENPQGRHSLC